MIFALFLGDIHYVQSDVPNSSKNKSPYLFDNNCRDFALQNDYVRGNKKIINDIEQRTERYFVWDKLSKDYKTLINSEKLKSVSHERYKNYNPLNPPESLLLCRDNKGKMDGNCLAFKAYCTEEVAMKGMKEELEEWRVRVATCTNPKYLELHPDHCQRDFIKSMHYLKHHATELARAHDSKTPEVAKYFTEAAATFSQYANELDQLLLAQEKAKKAQELKEEHEKKQMVLKNQIYHCQQVINFDDNDVNNNQFTKDLITGMSCVADDSVKYLNQSQVEKLASDLDQISLEGNAPYLLKEINKEALHKAAKAAFVGFDRFLNTGNSRDLSKKTDRDWAIQNIFCNPNKFAKDYNLSPLFNSQFNKQICGDKKSLEVINKALDEYLAHKKYNPVKYLTEEDIKEELHSDINSAVNDINQSCLKSKEAYNEIEREYNCQGGTLKLPGVDNNKKNSFTNYGLGEKKYHFKLPSGDIDYQVPQMFEPQGQMTESYCKGIIDSKYGQHRVVQHYTAWENNARYSQMINTKLGHLMITDTMRSKMNALDDDWIYNRCFKGSGKALNPLTVKDIHDSKKELMKLALEEIDDIGKESFAPDDKVDSIKQYLKSNPLTVADLLLKNPSKEYADALCAFMRDINSDEYWDSWVKAGITGVQLVSGVILAATGVGAPLGGALISTVAGGAFVASTVAEVNVYNNDIDMAQKQQYELQHAGATLQIEVENALNKIDKEKIKESEARFSRNLSIVMISVDFLAFGGGKIISAFTKTSKGKSVLKLVKGVENSVETEKEIAESVKRGLSKLNDLGHKQGLKPEIINALSEEDAMYMAVLVDKMNESQKLSFLENIKKLENSKQLKKYIDLLEKDSYLFNDKGILDSKRLSYNADLATEYELPLGIRIKDHFAKSEKLILDSNELSKMSKLDEVKAVDEMKVGPHHDITLQNNGGILSTTDNSNLKLVQNAKDDDDFFNIYYQASQSSDEGLFLQTKDEIIDLINTGKVKEMKPLTGGSSGNTFLVELDNGVTGVFKTNKDGVDTYLHEIAYYRLDQELGLNTAPLTIEKEINGSKGSFQLFIKNGVEAEQSGESTVNSNIKLLDYLSGEPDRSIRGIERKVGGNFMKLPDGKEVPFDNGRAFSEIKPLKLQNSELIKIVGNEKNMARILEINDEVYLTNKFGDILTPNEIKSFKENINKVKKLKSAMNADKSLNFSSQVIKTSHMKIDEFDDLVKMTDSQIKEADSIILTDQNLQRVFMNLDEAETLVVQKMVYQLKSQGKNGQQIAEDINRILKECR